MSELELVERRIKAGALQSIFAAVCTAGLALGLLAAAVYQAAHRQLCSAGFIALLGLGLGAAALALANAARSQWSPQTTPLYLAFSSRPEGLGWAYGVTGKTNGVRIHLMDGSVHTLTANGEQSRTLLALVRQKAPQAILGFGKDEQAEFTRRIKAARASG